MKTVVLNSPESTDLVTHPAAPWDGMPLARAYWQEEVRLGCEPSLERLRAICAARGWGFSETVEGLKQ